MSGDATASSGLDGAAGGGDASTLGDAGVRDWPSAACMAQTSTLLGMMTRAEKAGQMLMAILPATAADIQTYAPGAAFVAGGGGPPPANSAQPAAAWATWTDTFYQAAATTRLKIPIFIGLDAVHGQNGATGTTIFPHNAGLGSSRDPALVEQVTHITALESAATGITWAFAPVTSVAWDYRWGRVYESFSGDETLTGLLAAASVTGFQGSGGLNTGMPGIVACAKHFAGDGQMSPPSAIPPGIVDRGNILLDLAGLTKYGINPYVPVLQAGLGCLMVSDATWNGVSLTSDAQILTTILKGPQSAGGLGFKGFVISDYNAATAHAGGIIPTINAGVDMLMQVAPTWQSTITTITNSTAISDARLNDAVTRILNVKCESGMFTYKRDPTLLASVGSPEHRAVARKAVQESLVVLQNTGNVLPLAKTSKVFVEGTGATSLAKQCGGWTISWQGNGAATQGTTIAQAIAKVTPPMASLALADVDIVVMGEMPYAEFQGDRASIDTLPVQSPGDLALVDAAHAAGKKVVAIVLSGRPVIIEPHLANADVWIAAWLPGTEGDGVADVIFGDYKPTGKLSHAWPHNANQYNLATTADAGSDFLFPIGFGL